MPVLALYFFVLFTVNVRSANTYQVSSGQLTILQNYSSSVQSSTNTQAATILLWNQSWIASFNQTWSTAATGQYATGKLLPPDIAALLGQATASYNEQTIASYLSNGAPPILGNQSEMDAFSSLVVTFVNSITNGVTDAIPQLLTSRGNVIPPSKGDIISYYIASVSLTSAVPCNQISSAQLNEWTALATCSNPICRLLAAEGFRRIAPSSAWPAFYATYANETDPAIATVAVNMLWSTTLKSNISVLQQIQQGQKAIGNIAAANIASQAIQKLQSHGH